MIIAIDPGASGGIAVHKAEPDTTRVFKMPDTISDLVELTLLLFREYDINKPVVYMEQLTGFTGRINTGSTSFKMGKFYYPFETLCHAFEKRLVMVPPQKWMKKLGLGTRSSYTDQNKWKGHLKEVAQRLYPSMKVTLHSADALLILEYAKGEEQFKF